MRARCLATGESSVTVTIMPSIESSKNFTYTCIFNLHNSTERENYKQESEGTELSPSYSVAKI